MRDPKRIDRMIDKIHDLWHYYPDQRLGQLLINEARDWEHNAFENFYELEDDLLEKGLDKRLKKLGLTITEEPDDEC